MKGIWLHRNGKANLIIFCCGWGMDANPFQSMASRDHDVYMLYDYQDLELQESIDIIATGFKQLFLVGWSMGVWAGQKLFASQKARFHRSIAINGTLCPVDDDWGIPQAAFSGTLADYNESGKMKFYRRMCRDKTILERFLRMQPRRSCNDQHRELTALEKQVDCISVRESIYSQIIVAEHDRIVPSANQRTFWADKQITVTPGNHFLFYLWPSWEHLLAFAGAPACS